MRKLFIFAFLANVVLNVVSYMVLPARVAIHFGWGGIPNSWAPKEVNATIFFVMLLLFLLLCLVVPPLVFRLPPGFINLPNKDYWFKEENLPKVREKFAAFMLEFGIALFAFFFLVGFLVMDANLAEPVRLKEGLLWFGLIAFVLYSIFWCAKMFRAFKIPQNLQNR